MFEAKCYDMHGNSVDGFTQWDVNQRIKIVLENCEDDNHIEDDFMRIVPDVHFSNPKREKALVVRAAEARKDNIVVDVPNILLTEPYPILIYVYYTSSKDSSSQTTIVRTELPVRKRNEPHDYYYVENIERITAEMIKEEIEADTKNTLDKAKTDIGDLKNSAVTSIEEARDQAVTKIGEKQSEAELKLQEYVTEGSTIKTQTEVIQAATETIKTETEAIKNATNEIKGQVEVLKQDVVDIAATAADKIKTDIYDEIHNSGVQLKMKNEDNGICTIYFVTIDQE